MSTMPRFYCSIPLSVGELLELPAGAARHVQVLRMQPMMALTLFDGRGGEYQAVIQNMARTSVAVQVTAHHAIEREATRAVHLALGVPANERMDWLVEKATELGATSIQPLMTERGVLRLLGPRADKKQTHWQAIASSACEQSGRNRVPTIHPVQTLGEYLVAQESSTAHRMVLSLQPQSPSLAQLAASTRADAPVWLLSGAEGGLSHAEETNAMRAGYLPANLGNRVLRAETAALAALVALNN